jgi:uncharacterized membrane protein YfcA
MLIFLSIVIDSDNENLTDGQQTPDGTSAEPHPKIPLHTRFWLSLKMGVVGKLLPVWAIGLVLSLFVVYMLEALLPAASPCDTDRLTTTYFVITAFVSLACMYIDSTLGMGYGTTLTPILLLMGYDPLKVVPALLVCQWLAGIAAGISHQSAGNIDLRGESLHFRVALVLAACGIVGALIAVRVFVSIDKSLLTTIIGTLVLIVGLIIFITRGRRYRFSWRKIIALGLIASFCKGLSAGGYGPIVTGGQILSGVGGKQAIGITALSEGLTCLVAVMAFLATGEVHDLQVAYPLVIGALCSVPLSAYTVRQLTMKRLTTLIATITIVLGLATIGKVVWPIIF